jgi:cell division protein FtsB
MRELQQRQKLKKRIYSIPSLLLLFLLVLISIKGTWEVMNKKRSSEQYVKSLEAQSQELTERQKNLEEDISYLNTEEGIDEEIKQRFNVSKAGEKVVVIVDPKPISTTTDKNSKIWYLKIWNAIIDFL